MVHQYRTNFPHRLNPDGSYDSICTLCRLAIATVRIEADLSRHEHNHKCSQGVSTPRIPLRLQSTALLSFCSCLKATGFLGGLKFVSSAQAPAKCMAQEQSANQAARRDME